MQSAKSLGDSASPWYAPHHATWRLGNTWGWWQHYQHHLRLCMCLALPSWRTLWQSYFHSKHDHRGLKNSYPRNYFFLRRNAYFRNELIHLEGSTSHLLVLASFQPPKAYQQLCHSNFARLDNEIKKWTASHNSRNLPETFAISGCHSHPFSQPHLPAPWCRTLQHLLQGT